MRKFLLLLAALVAWPTAAPAADPGPTVELRIKAIKDLLPLASYFGGIVGQEEQAEQGAKFVEAMAGKKGVIEGIDINRPMGVYAAMTPAVIDSPIVAMVPVGDETAFLNLLRGKLNLAPTKGDDEVYAVAVPMFPPKVYFTFHKGYACIAVHNKDALSAKNLPDPKAFFAKEEAAVLALTVHLDRVPEDVRKPFLGQFELAMADAKTKPTKSPAEKAGRDLAIDAGLDTVNTLLKEGAAASLRLTVDPKADEIGLDFSLTARDGTDLRSTLASVAKRKAVAPLATAKDAVLSIAANLKVPDAYKKKYEDAVDLMIADALENAKGNDREGAKRFFDAVEPTLKSGLLQLGVAFTAPSADKHELIAAVRMTGGKEIEKLAKEFAPFIPENVVKVKFDADKAGETPLHEITPPADDKVEKLFGKSAAVWLTTADDLFVVGFADDKAAVKKLAQATPAVTPLVSFEASLSRLMPLVDDKLTPDQVKGVVKEAFGDVKPAGNDTVKLLVTAGDKLTVGLTAKGRALKLLAMMDKKKKE